MAHLYSMTGFGKAILQLPAKKITIEVKSLNSKQLDINVRMPSFYKEKESPIRQKLAEELNRGKIDLNFYSEVTGAEKAPRVNRALVVEYISQLKGIMDETGVEGDIMSAVMRLPDVMQAAEDEVDEAEWKAIQEVVHQAVEQLNGFRADEGATLKVDLDNRIAIIREKMAGIDVHEEDRVKRIKEKLSRGLAEIAEKPDENRYEQELIYYLEKLDVTEEKVRLKSHLDYFEQLLNEGGPIGKKLGFISQEIGREINTMGSKANHAAMQKLVVEMKDELEKIKEQVLNIL
ncbi:YicC/YloC family endoribonuclease [Owenweeksia hongkongensis]|uniref:TIGR00255 family protein n=1 Tax=Owenweeksia hongkongensis (strain DSM 17368 / CIP 108786 / JCM 12287 / NRRL B-23963 / UST20020801) TaxID=926562 RepID=G8R444_OWEHD|nr:YicC/YloC family endoribonuclease [Owenweeksia hongkongensis]AEV33111.1 TIGR00255 family protein [Owenweeksia hongkongensis DSM 17368]